MLWKGFQKPKRLAVDTSSLTDKYGIFWAQPFERGFGTTIGNALRRVMLSSIEWNSDTLQVSPLAASTVPMPRRPGNDTSIPGRSARSVTEPPSPGHLR